MRKREDLESLIQRARQVPMSASDMEAQRRSFVYGNIAIENPHVTRELVDRVADRLKRSSSQ